MKNQLILFCCLFASSLAAQQLSTNRLYREQLNVQNPAAFSREYIFETNTTVFGISHRQQWVGVEDAPMNTSVCLELVDAEALPVVGGGGFWGVHDRTGKLGFSTGAVNFKAAIPLTGRRSNMEHFLSAGVALGFTQHYFKASEIEWKDEDDPVVFNQTQAGYFDVSAGIFLYGKKERIAKSGIKGYYLGISAPQIFEPDPDFSIDTEPVLKRKRHYFAFGGIRVKTYGESYWEPSIYFRHVENAPLSFDANMRWKFSDLMWAGAGFGTSSAHLETGFELLDNVMKINFAYDFTWQLFYGHSIEVNATWAWR